MLYILQLLRLDYFSFVSTFLNFKYVEISQKCRSKYRPCCECISNRSIVNPMVCYECVLNIFDFEKKN